MILKASPRTLTNLRCEGYKATAAALLLPAASGRTVLHKPMHSRCREPMHTGEGKFSHTKTTIAACLEWPVPFHCSHSYSEPTICHLAPSAKPDPAAEHGTGSKQHELVVACPADQRECRSQAHSRDQKGQDSHSPSAQTVLVPHLFAEVSTAAVQLDQKPQACH